jgi:small subunit ribosomal protein S6
MPNPLPPSSLSSFYAPTSLLLAEFYFLLPLFSLSLRPHFKPITYMFPNNYETVFILTPVLSDLQMKDAVDKFRKVLTDNGAELVHEENMGLRKLAYPIQHKNTGYYQLFEFKAPGTIIEKLNTEYLRDERIIRHLTISLDKHAVSYNDRKRNGLVGKKKQTENAGEAK